MNQALETYLETQVTTATPQRLRLMLVQGALRFANLTGEHWRNNEAEAGAESLIRCRRIVSELLTTIRDGESELNQKMTDLYRFLFQSLTEAQRDQDQTKIAEVIKVLEEERNTWTQVCETHPNDTAFAKPDAPKEVTARNSGMPSVATTQAPAASGGFSVDA